jgi:hypothetical protein
MNGLCGSGCPKKVVTGALYKCERLGNQNKGRLSEVLPPENFEIEKAVDTISQPFRHLFCHYFKKINQPVLMIFLLLWLLAENHVERSYHWISWPLPALRTNRKRNWEVKCTAHYLFSQMTPLRKNLSPRTFHIPDILEPGLVYIHYFHGLFSQIVNFSSKIIVYSCSYFFL